MTRYRIVFAIDLVLLWSRLGGVYAVFGAIATLIASKTGSAPWLSWILGLAAAAMAVLGVVRVLPAVKVWQCGVAVTGQVVEVEKRRKRGSDHVSLTTRVRFAFQLDGHEHAGVSVFWDEDLPIRMPPVAFP